MSIELIIVFIALTLASTIVVSGFYNLHKEEEELRRQHDEDRRIIKETLDKRKNVLKSLKK